LPDWPNSISGVSAVRNAFSLVFYLCTRTGVYSISLLPTWYKSDPWFLSLRKKLVGIPAPASVLAVLVGLGRGGTGGRGGRKRRRLWKTEEDLQGVVILYWWYCIYYIFRRHNCCTYWINLSSFHFYNMFRQFRPSSHFTLTLCFYYSPTLTNVYNFKRKVKCVIRVLW
jgi:hypothetical protein